MAAKPGKDHIFLNPEKFSEAKQYISGKRPTASGLMIYLPIIEH
jgi:hypothetical protein